MFSQDGGSGITSCNTIAPIQCSQGKIIDEVDIECLRKFIAVSVLKLLVDS